MLSHALAPLSVRNRQIVRTEDGSPILLRGVNRSGLEYCSPESPGSLAKAGITSEEIAMIATGWRANVIRLPFNQSWALARDTDDAEPYLAAVDFVIEQAALNGAYTLLDLQWLDAATPRGHFQDGSRNFVAPLPNFESIELWRQLARRYRAEPAVLYDIFNEPHDPLPDDPLASGLVTMAEWQPWARRLIDAIRAENNHALIFVSGLEWGYHLSGFPLPGVEGVVYSTHVYPGKGLAWDRAFGDLALTAPVFAAEWGGGDEDIAWGEALAGYFDAREIGWAAWSWSDWPRLVQKPAPPYAPTRFGNLVRSRLSRNLS